MNYLLIILSSVLLTLAFPNFNFAFLAWFALVPFLHAVLNAESRKSALGIGFLMGLFFWGLSVWWLRHVAFLAWLLVVPIQALFMMLFALFVYWAKDLKSSLFRILWIGLSWTVCEWLRGEMPPLAVSWNSLAYSQADYPWVAMTANTIGAYGLGFVIALANGFLIEIVLLFKNSKNKSGDAVNPMLRKEYQKQGSKKVIGIVALLLFLLSAVLAHGWYYSQQEFEREGSIRIGVIQGNIPQHLKWEMSARDEILEIHDKLTRLAYFERPDVIFWPEAAFPGYFNRDVEAQKVLDLAQELKQPMVVGGPHWETEAIAFNSAYLVSGEGRIEGRYDKNYLVPFGEYVPLKMIFGWLEPFAYAMGVSDFTPGDSLTLFKLNEKIQFGTLICFEDVFASMARQLVNNGARFLAVITNDAWFMKTSAPWQHTQASVFRAIENGVSVIRAANTGISGFISPKGEVIDLVHDESGEASFVTGFKVAEIPIVNSMTHYRSFGWTFPYVAIGLFLILLFPVLGRKI